MNRVSCNRYCKLFTKFIRGLLSWLCGLAGLSVLPEGWEMYNPVVDSLLPAGNFRVDPVRVKQFGDVNRAIIFDVIDRWVASNARRGKDTFRDGRWHTYALGYKEWSAQLSGIFSSRTIERHVKALERDGHLTSQQPFKGRGDNRKAYATTCRDGHGQLVLWPTQVDEMTLTTCGDSQESLQQSSQHKTRKTPTARARKTSAAVAEFKSISNSGDLVERKPDIPETHASEQRDGQDDAPTPTPISAAPLPHALTVLPDELIRTWRQSWPVLEMYVKQHGAATVTRAWEQAATGFDRSRVGGMLYLLREGQVKAPEVTTEVETVPDDNAPNTPIVDELEYRYPQTEAEARAEARWNIAYTQLEIQLDRAAFDTWLRGAFFIRLDEKVFVIGCANSYARDMLNHRLIREVRRVLSDVVGERVEARFEVVEKPALIEDDLPLFKLLSRGLAVAS